MDTEAHGAQAVGRPAATGGWHVAADARAPAGKRPAAVGGRRRRTATAGSATRFGHHLILYLFVKNNPHLFRSLTYMSHVYVYRFQCGLFDAVA